MTVESSKAVVMMLLYPMYIASCLVFCCLFDKFNGPTRSRGREVVCSIVFLLCVHSMCGLVRLLFLSPGTRDRRTSLSFH